MNLYQYKNDGENGDCFEFAAFIFDVNRTDGAACTQFRSVFFAHFNFESIQIEQKKCKINTLN